MDAFRIRKEVIKVATRRLNAGGLGRSGGKGGHLVTSVPDVAEGGPVRASARGHG